MIKDSLLLKFCKISRNFYYRNPDNLEKILNGGNEIRKSKKNGKYKIISFADKHFRRMKNMYFFKRKLDNYKIIDKVNVFRLSDIKSSFLNRNKNLFSDKRIFPWIAKAYLVNKVLEESDFGDTILWVDSDIIDIKESCISNLYNLCNNSENGIVGFHSDFWLERTMTKIDLLNYLNLSNKDFSNTNQIYANMFIFRKNNFTINILREYLRICSIEKLMDNSKSKEKESKHFITHKNDQSILSLLFKINNIKTFPIPFYDLDRRNIIAQHSGFFNEGVKLPIVWHKNWHNISIEEMWLNCNKKFNKIVSPYDCLSVSTDYLEESNNL